MILMKMRRCKIFMATNDYRGNDSGTWNSDFQLIFVLQALASFNYAVKALALNFFYVQISTISAVVPFIQFDKTYLIINWVMNKNQVSLSVTSFRETVNICVTLLFTIWMMKEFFVMSHDWIIWSWLQGKHWSSTII